MKAWRDIRLHGFSEWLAIKLAWALPRQVALWAFIRVMAHATSGKNGHLRPDEVRYCDAYDAWHEPA